MIIVIGSVAILSKTHRERERASEVPGRGSDGKGDSGRFTDFPARMGARSVTRCWIELGVDDLGVFGDGG